MITVRIPWWIWGFEKDPEYATFTKKNKRNIIKTSKILNWIYTLKKKNNVLHNLPTYKCLIIWMLLFFFNLVYDINLHIHLKNKHE